MYKNHIPITNDETNMLSDMFVSIADKHGLLEQSYIANLPGTWWSYAHYSQYDGEVTMPKFFIEFTSDSVTTTDISNYFKKLNSIGYDCGYESYRASYLDKKLFSHRLSIVKKRLAIKQKIKNICQKFSKIFY